MPFNTKLNIMKRLFSIIACMCMMIVSCDNYMPIPDEEQNPSGEVTDGDSEGTQKPGGGNGGGNSGGGSYGGGDSDGNGGDNDSDGDNGDSDGDGTGDYDGDNGGSGGNGNSGGSGSDYGDNSPLPLDPAPIVSVEQKEKIENALRSVMEELPAEDYRNLLELAREFYDFGEDNFDDAYDISALEEVWEGDLYSKMFIENENMFDVYEYFFRISECKGIATFYDTYATYTESDQAKIVVKNVEGKDWIFTLETTQWAKGLYIGTIDDECLYADVPSEIKARLTIGSNTYADVILKLKYNISANGIDPGNDNVSVTSTIKIDDIGLTVENTGYNARTGDAAVKMTFTKGSKKILSVDADANATVRYNNDYEPVSYNIKGASFIVDLMSEVQFVGNVKDAQTLIDDIYNERLEVEGNISGVQKAAAAINQRANICISYNGGKTAQAQIVADYFEDEDYPGYYYVAPVLVFSDNSRYGFIEFFEDHIESDLDGWEEEIENFMESYIELFEEIFEGLL